MIIAQVHPGAIGTAAAIAALLLWRRRHLELPLLIGGGVLIAATLLIGFGIVAMPNIKQTIEDLAGVLGGWTYLVVGVMAFLETGAFVGLIAPGESFMVLGGVVAGQGRVSLVGLIAIGWICAVGGDAASFYAGHRLGRGWLERHGPRFGITAERLASVDGFFDRHGGKAVFIGRFIGLVRAVNPFLAGASGMPFRRFIPYSILGAGAWATMLLVLGYVFWRSIDQVLAIAERGAMALAVGLTVLIAIVLLIRHLRDVDRRRALQRWIDQNIERYWPARLGFEETVALAVAAVGAFVFVALAIETGEQGVLFSDRHAFRIAAELRSDWLTSLAKAVTMLGSTVVLLPAIIVAVVVLLRARRRLAAAVLASGSILTWAAVQSAKALIDRPRPSGALIETVGASYPSGHSAHAVVWIAIAIIAGRSTRGLTRQGLILAVGIAIVVLVGATRVYLRAHYLSDVTGGIGLGCFVFALCTLIGLSVRHNDRDRL